ncbi:hypothetical protein [Oceanicoccus sagamiensis]|uniref:Uncharacterized protein n=1 Tax=Oceanicoccus sagamiensis TaxID=716816 RepID=A0A1X9NH09_9GAMM|nr:hypothetical protein [Oceanicoccus sagamiensis]ARN75682.1 hypothetical protein BST96_17155 [Oceanicoccus sagamiensis]
MNKTTFSLAVLTLLMAKMANAEFYTDPKALQQLLSGNSLVGSYNELQFIQTLNTDGTVMVAVKGEKTPHKAKWFINDKAEYCEQWPDHTSCFQIGLDGEMAKPGQKQLLKVKSHDDADIVSYLHQGIIPLTFATDSE